MRPFALFFLFIRLPLDYLAVVLAGTLAYVLRFGPLAEWRHAQQLIPFERYQATVLFLAFLWIAAFTAAGLYQSRRLRAADELARVFMASSAAIMAVVILIFFRREFFASRFIVLAGWTLSFFFVIVERLIVRLVERILLARGYGRRRVAVIGSEQNVAAFVRAANQEPGLAIEVVGRYAHFDDRAEAALLRVRRGRGLDEIVVIDAALAEAEQKRILRFVDETQVSLRYSAALFAARRASVHFTSIAGIPLLEVRHTSLEGWGRIYKRFFDIIASFVLLLLLSPVLLLIALFIKLDSPGPVLYVRKRVGERGKLFSFYKFRSMKIDAPERLSERKRLSMRPGPIPKLKEDPRWVTAYGRFLRRWSLDELPQLWNVFRGEMSLVGPRPHLPAEVAGYEPEQKKLLMVKPGLTGLAQISGRADLSFEDEARLDLGYIEHWSPLFDLAILLRTPIVVLVKKGAY